MPNPLDRIYTDVLLFLLGNVDGSFRFNFSELPEQLKEGGLFKDQFVCFVDHAKGTKWYRPTTLSELAKVQKNHETFRRFMGGTGGYKRNFNYNHPVTVQLDAIQDLVGFITHLMKSLFT